ncbi:MAG: SCO family protein [Legionellales bacterium]|nr:SCO family protein [Legionellales bacterium]
MNRPNNLSFRRYGLPILLLLLFIGPMIAAWSLYRSGGEFIEDTVNRGTLIQPPAVLQNLTLKTVNGFSVNPNYLQGKWLLLYVTPAQCSQTCLDNLKNLQSIVRALGKDQNRVQRVIITPSTIDSVQNNEAIAKVFPDTIQASVNPVAWKNFIAQIKVKSFNPNQAHVFIADPLKNIMLTYQDNTKPRPIYQDLKRLLQVSQIG